MQVLFVKEWGTKYKNIKNHVTINWSLIKKKKEICSGLHRPGFFFGFFHLSHKPIHILTVISLMVLHSVLFIYFLLKNEFTKWPKHSRPFSLCRQLQTKTGLHRNKTLPSNSWTNHRRGTVQCNWHANFLMIEFFFSHLWSQIHAWTRQFSSQEGFRENRD